jgi:hypothetical protein
MQTNQRIDRKIVYFGPLADHLPVNLAFRRNIDDHVTQEARRAAQAPAFGKAINLIVSNLVFA